MLPKHFANGSAKMKLSSMKSFLSLLILVSVVSACNMGEAPNLRVGDPGQTTEERDIFRDRGKVCTEELEAKGKC